MFFVGILFGFLPVRIHELGYNPFNTGLLLSVTTVSYLLVQPVAGWLADKYNQVLILRLGMLLSIVSTAAVPFVTGTLLIITCIVAGIGIGVGGQTLMHWLVSWQRKTKWEQQWV